MSKRAFLGFATVGLSEVFHYGPKSKERKARQAAEQGAKDATADAKAKTASDKVTLTKSQNAKQFAAANTASKGFGSNSLDNLSRSFLLRL